LIQQAGQQRGDLIARIFAETGVKDLMRGIAYMMSKYSTKAMTVRLRNQWVEIDPREWKTQFDMTVNVGLGTGNKDVQIAHLGALGAKQMELMQTGRGHLVTDENVYNLYKKTGEAMGFKHPEVFVSDPANVQRPQPQPNPDMMKIMAEAEESKAKIKSNEQIRMFDAQTQKELEQIKSQTAIAIARIEAETKEKIAQMQITADAQLAVFNGNNDLETQTLALEVKKQDINAQDQLLSLKKNFDAIVDKERRAVVSGNDEKIAQHTGAVMQTVINAGQQVVSQIQGLQQLLDNMGKVMALQAESQKQANAKQSGPKVVRIGKVKTDDKGIITSAEING